MACATCGFAADVDVSTPALTVPQVYRGTSYRDPFKVAVVFGDEHGPKSKTALSDVASSTFSIYNLSLVGIMEDSRSKEALFSDKTTGLVYTLKGGRLLDSKKKQVPGVSGVVKGKQVVLMTEDKKIHQLNLHEKESPDPE
jgi:Tfp pilus assembly protein PilP